MNDVPLELTIDEACALKETGHARWIDCRELDEWHICHIEGAELLPLSRFVEEAKNRLSNHDQKLVVYCHHGVRSLRAVHWLRREGFSQAQSLSGGIDRWAETVDPDMARY